VTAEEYDTAYSAGFAGTVRLLVSRGINYDTALDTAQTAWARGWECRGQLRNPAAVCGWMNRIAINAYRASLRRAAIAQHYPDTAPLNYIDLAAIDVKHILNRCQPNERGLLEAYYIQGYRAKEIALERGCSEVAVGIRLYRARRAVMRLLRGGTLARRHPLQGT